MASDKRKEQLIDYSPECLRFEEGTLCFKAKIITILSLIKVKLYNVMNIKDNFEVQSRLDRSSLTAGLADTRRKGPYSPSKRTIPYLES